MVLALPAAAIDIILILGICLLALCILPQTRDAVSNLITAIPVLGSSVNTAYRNWVEGLIASLTQWLDQQGGGLAGAILLPWQRVVALFGEVAHTQADTVNAVNQAPYAAIHYVETQDIPYVQGEINDVGAALLETQSWANQQFAAETAAYTANHAESQAWVDNLSANVQAFNDWVVQQLQAHSATEAAIEAEARGWVDNLSQNVDAFNRWAVDQLTSQAQSIGYVEGEANDWARAAQDNATAYAAAAAASAEAGAIAWTTANAVVPVQALASDYADFLKNCGNPLCDGLGETAKILTGLKQLIGTGAMLAFVAAAIIDPIDTADAVDTLVGPLAAGTYGSIRSATGL